MSSSYWFGPTSRGLIASSLDWRVPAIERQLRLLIKFPLIEGRLIGESVMYLCDNSGIGLR